MDINDPETLAQVRLQLARYEEAFTSNDVVVLDELLWNSAHTLRYGAGENLYGYEEIARFRSACPAQGVRREVLKTVITTFGRDFATANVEFCLDGNRGTGRESQTWARITDGWRIVAAHVSLLAPPPKTAIDTFVQENLTLAAARLHGLSL